jgi:hypothetical protein
MPGPVENFVKTLQLAFCAGLVNYSAFNTGFSVLGGCEVTKVGR